MISQKLYPVSFLEYLAIVHGCSYQIYTGHFNRYSSIEKNKADTISCGPPLTSKITCFLPVSALFTTTIDIQISFIIGVRFSYHVLKFCEFFSFFGLILLRSSQTGKAARPAITPAT